MLGYRNLVPKVETMNTIRIKICGITRPEDAVLAAQLGANAIGLVFFAGSKRCVSVEQAQRIVRSLPPFVQAVALFVNETEANIRHVLAHVPIHTLQFHGDEPPEFCQSFQRPFLKAVRVQSAHDIQAACTRFAEARALLFDAFVDGAYGGTGHTFDWRLLPEQLSQHWILSGGLNPDNVAHALKTTGAMAVDVSSGVEQSAGIKSPEKLRAFFAAIRSAA